MFLHGLSYSTETSLNKVTSEFYLYYVQYTEHSSCPKSWLTEFQHRDDKIRYWNAIQARSRTEERHFTQFRVEDGVYRYHF